MKKTFLLIMCGILSLTLVTGCGSEKEKTINQENDNKENTNVVVLTCTNSIQNNHISTNRTLTFDFKNSQLNKIEWKDVDTPEKEWWNEWWKSKEDEYLNIQEEQLKGIYEDIPSVTYNVSMKEDITTTVKTYNVNENNQAELEKDTLLYNDIKDIHNDYSKIKEYFENEGYTCK